MKNSLLDENKIIEENTPKVSIERKEFIRFSTKKSIITVALSLLYFLWFNLVIDLRGEHIVLYLICLFGYYLHPLSRKFVAVFAIFILYWIVYDSMKAFPNYDVSPVNIKEPYDIEKHWFGIRINGELLTPNEYFRLHTTDFLNVLTGLFYLCWIPVPLGWAVYLFFKDTVTSIRFLYAFVFCNFLGFVVYYFYPAAPPWYVELYGFTRHFNISGNVAGLASFDEFFNINLFHSIYSKGSNVFAAMPSLHSAYPMIVLYYGLKKRMYRTSVFFAVVTTGIWFSAVYSRHHYIIDVLAGISCAILALLIFEGVLVRYLKKYFSSIAE